MCTIGSIAGTKNEVPHILDWITANGGWVSPELRVQVSAHSGRGLYTKSNVEASSLLISLPFNCSLSEHFALKTLKGIRKLQRYLENNQTARFLVSKNVLLSTYIMVKMRSGQGAFAVYLRDQRTHYRSMMDLPWLWSVDELSELEGTGALGAVNVAMAVLVNEFSVVMHALPELENKYSIRHWFVAASLVNSHMLGQPPSLLPGIDLANHFLPKPDSLLSMERGEDFVRQVSATTLVRDVRTGVYEFRANRAHKQGEEVFFQYGLVDNVHYLTMYGFVVPWIHNLTCLAQVKLEVPVQDLLTMRFARPWMKTKIEATISLKLNSCGDGNIHDIIAFARLWSSHAVWSDVQADCGLTLLVGNPSEWRLNISCEHVSREEEMTALGFVQSLIVARRSKMVGGNLKEEESLIENPSTPPRLRAAATIRRDEKYVLHQAEQLVSQARKQLLHAGSDWRTYLSHLSQSCVVKSSPH
eukprot:TRINITY_DN13988_c0_g1_i2.p1 TRINITY_DN13988_c0_g1~~TRINITY_DN13988_c0_g1_i2.p1  ORF type:complete len:491 (+),score=53.65 TRINITY_DN13988_c0_g1_i2:60-1475(+)